MESNIATSWKKSKHYRGKKKWKLWFYYDFIMETLILLWFYLQIDQLFPADFPASRSGIFPVDQRRATARYSGGLPPSERLRGATLLVLFAWIQCLDIDIDISIYLYIHICIYIIYISLIYISYIYIYILYLYIIYTYFIYILLYLVICSIYIYIIYK